MSSHQTTVFILCHLISNRFQPVVTKHVKKRLDGRLPTSTSTCHEIIHSPQSAVVPLIRCSTVEGFEYWSGVCVPAAKPSALRRGPRRVPQESPRRAAERDTNAIRYMPEYMPENLVEQSAFKRLPILQKTCVRMPSDVLEEKRAVVIYLQQCTYYRISLKGASQNKIDNDGEQQNNFLQTPKANNVNKRLKLFCLAYGEYKNMCKLKLRPNTEQNTEKRLLVFFSATANSKRCSPTTSNKKRGPFFFPAYGNLEKGRFIFLPRLRRKKARNKRKRLRRKTLRAKSRLAATVAQVSIYTNVSPVQQRSSQLIPRYNCAIFRKTANVAISSCGIPSGKIYLQTKYYYQQGK